MSSLSTGARRLSIAAGAVSVVVWLVYAGIVTKGFQVVDGSIWRIIALNSALAFFAPWALVRGIAWAVVAIRARR